MRTPQEIVAVAVYAELDEHGYEDDDEKRGQVAHHLADVMLSALKEDYAITLRSPCRCGCGLPSGEHLCPCGCGHTYQDAVRKVMQSPMCLNWEQASANIDEHKDVPCKWQS